MFRVLCVGTMVFNLIFTIDVFVMVGLRGRDGKRVGEEAKERWGWGWASDRTTNLDGDRLTLSAVCYSIAGTALANSYSPTLFVFAFIQAFSYLYCMYDMYLTFKGTADATKALDWDWQHAQFKRVCVPLLVNVVLVLPEIFTFVLQSRGDEFFKLLTKSQADGGMDCTLQRSAVQRSAVQCMGEAAACVCLCVCAFVLFVCCWWGDGMREGVDFRELEMTEKKAEIHCIVCSVFGMDCMRLAL
jgi:hypothetical protein